MPPSRASVLLVDDQPANLLALEVVLDSLGLNLVRAQSGEQALAELQQADFAAVLLDVRMPGMDGLQAARLIRALPRTRSTPILFITADDDAPRSMAEAYNLGAVDFLAKPLVPAMLRAKVAVFVDLYRSREELRASRDERLRLATEASGIGVWVWNAQNGQVTWEHEWIYDIFGMPRDAEPLNGERFVAEFLHPEDRARFVDAVEATLRDGQPFSFEGRILRRPDRSLRWLEMRGRLQSTTVGQPSQLLGTVADVTQRKHFEQRLLASEERYRTLFESIDEGFCLIEIIRDASGAPRDYRFIEANQAFEKHTGLRDAVGKTMREMVPDHDAHWFEIYSRVATSGEPVRFVEEAKAMGRWFDVYATRIGDKARERVAILFTDITARRQAEQDLRRLATELAEADRRKTEFLATLAHELRNPLAPLSNGLHLMRMAGEQADVQERTRQMMERQIQHLVHLVDDLLDVARISTGKIELRRQRIDLKDVVASAVETSSSLIETAGHVLTVSLPDHPLPLDADPTRLAQVIANLLNNAAKYTPPNGSVTLSVEHGSDEVALTVKDTGIGIPQESLSSVFEMFTQVRVGAGRQQGGLGIGLSLVQSLVHMHGGTVRAASEGPGRGSSFTVRLPLASSLVCAPAAGGGSARDQAATALRVLVVDDNADAAESLAFLLQLAGHAAQVAHDGRQALALAEAFKPQIVFLDIGLPDLSGYDVARQLRALPSMRDKVLVALTGWGTEHDRARSREAGFDHHLTKPAEITAVESLLSALARKPAAQAHEAGGI